MIMYLLELSFLYSLLMCFYLSLGQILFQTRVADGVSDRCLIGVFSSRFGIGVPQN